ncbi:MAG: hypothetical protein MJ174_07425 [Treponema sp.]|nr:hypothetical protein [Treponema sp.]
MDEEIYEVLNSYKQAIDVILGKLDEQAKEIQSLHEENNKLNSVLFDEILEPARVALEERAKSDRFDDFNAMYGEKLGGYDDVLKKMNSNDDFSLSKDIFDQYDALEEPKPEMDAFVEDAIQTVEQQIDALRDSLGIESDKEVAIVQDEEGNTKVVADGEVVAEENEATEEDGTEAPTEDGEQEEQPELDFDEEPKEEEATPEELKKYEEELAKML